jgi:hypothetical protein
MSLRCMTDTCGCPVTRAALIHATQRCCLRMHAAEWQSHAANCCAGIACCHSMQSACSNSRDCHTCVYLRHLHGMAHVCSVLMQWRLTTATVCMQNKKI